MAEPIFAALDRMTAQGYSVYGLNKVLRFQGHALATNGKSLLIAIGREDLGEADASETRVFSNLVGFDVLRDLKPVDWPELPEVKPLESCHDCKGKAKHSCDECGGSGHCPRCGEGDCDECDGAGSWPCGKCAGSGKPQKGDRQHLLASMRVGDLSSTIDVGRLAGDLEGLPSPTHALLGVVNGVKGRALLLAGEGYRYLICPVVFAGPSYLPTVEVHLADGEDVAHG